MRRRFITYVVGSLALSTISSSAHALELRLLCSGVATAPSAQTSNFSGYSSEGGAISGQTTSVRAEQFPADIQLEISETAARIRLPKRLVPPIHSGGQDNWWPLTSVGIGESEIEGQFRLNPLNKPKVRLDRVSGELDVDGSFRLSFHGTCSVLDPTQRKF